jgi:heme/copper-type cytochrome/quinol oxidase subunit 2
MQMTKAFHGFTFLIAALFPVGGYLAGILYGETPGVLPSVLYPLFSLALIYLAAAAATAWFFRSTQLASRVPPPVPGSTMLLIGSMLTVIYFVILLFAPTVKGGEVSPVDQRLLFILLPARALLAVGAAKLLLSARPTSLSLQTHEPQAAVELGA